MTGENRQRDIVEVLVDFHIRFSEAYASAVAFSETMPEQINNEIRNALTHLSRAADANAKGHSDGVDPELASAKRHLERANRDCYKLAVISVNGQLQATMKVLNQSGRAVTRRFQQHYEQAVLERLRIIVEESRAREGTQTYASVADRYRNLLRVLQKILSDMYSDYNINENYVKHYPLRSFVKRVSTWVCLLISTNIIAFFVGVYSNVYAAPVAEFVRRMIALATGWF